MRRCACATRQYVTDERVDAAYVTLSLDDLLDDPSIEVAEADVRSAYEADRAAAPAEQERRSRHMLLETGEDRSAEEARARLEAIRERIEAGASFADIAAEVSEDPGSAAQGGDLGFAGRGIFDPAFEEALFALEAPGDVSAPVQTDFGYHLIQLEEIRDNAYPDFESVRQDIERRLRREQAELVYAERLRELDNLAFEHPNDLEAIVEELGLERQTVDGVTRTEGPAPFDDSTLRDRLFSEDVLEKGFNSAAVEVGATDAVVIRVAERHEPAQIPFEAVAGEIRNAMEAARAGELAREAHAQALARLQAGDGVSEVANDFDANWQRFDAVRRNATEVPRAVLEAAFALPRPGSDGRSVGETTLPRGGMAVVAVTRVVEGDVQALTESELAGMRQFLGNRVSRQEFAALFETLRQQGSIARRDS